MRPLRGFTLALNKGAHPLIAPPSRIRAARGFTLIEVLVAVTIFAIISAMSFRVLTVILESRERVESATKRWREIGLAMSRIEQDLSSLVNRPARDAGGISQKPLVGVQVPRGDEGHLMLTRMGALDLPGALGAPQRVGYRFRDGVLEQLDWPVLDQGPRTRPTVTPILEGLNAFDIRYLDHRGQWHTLWPQRDLTSGGPGQDAPAAIEISMALASGERITRLIPTAWGLRS